LTIAQRSPKFPGEMDYAALIPAFLKKKPEPGWLVVQIGANTARFAHVWAPEDGRPKVLFCEEREWSAEDPRSLEKACKEMRAERFRCMTVLEAKDYQMLVVDAPNVEPGELKSAVRWRIKDMISYGVDDAVVDVLRIPPAPNSPAQEHSVYAVSVRADIVQKIAAQFAGLRVPLTVIDIPDTAQRNLSAHLEAEGKGLVLVSFAEDGGLITFTCGGELYLARRIDVDTAAVGEPDESRRALHIERAALEIQRSLDHFDRQFHHIVLDRVLVAPVAGVDDLAGRLAASVFVPVERFDLESVVDVSEVPPLQEAGFQSRWLKLIGAGMRPDTGAA